MHDGIDIDSFCQRPKDLFPIPVYTGMIKPHSGEKFNLVRFTSVQIRHRERVLPTIRALAAIYGYVKK
ncbi:hypothetical protein [Endozoicomonas sp. SESOKO3]|uniref:hypothetical protein n=1 Tax=Endozoicomonas sp. SESOKO3 TaxID=2828744 RepID=UPI0021472CC0|nr:hypothetical protein [Endozoicomonas sp. SESOKO3]